MTDEPIKLTAFLDILGYAKENQNIISKENAENLIAKFDTAKLFLNFYENDILKKFNLASKHTILEKYEFKYVFISDSIILSFQPIENSPYIDTNIDDQKNANAIVFLFFLHCIANLQVQVIKEFKLFLRGGISTEYSYINDHHAVGKGILESYKIESKVAIYPRVIFDKKMLEDYDIEEYCQYMNKIHLQPIKPYLIDCDSYVCIDYLLAFDLIDMNNKVNHDEIEHFKTFINLHDNIINDEISKNSDPHILQKYEWLSSYQQKKLKDIYNLLSIERYQDETKEICQFLLNYIPKPLGLGKMDNFISDKRNI
jgi:hypothetical protein